MLEKVKPTTAQETAALKSAKEQLQLSTKAIVERQKLIYLADRSEYGWQLMEAYQQEAYQQDELADSEKDAKWIEEAEKAVEVKNRRKHKQGSDKEKWTRSSLLASGCRSFRAVMVFHRHSIHATTV